ncbi:HAD hydrolase-like protein [Pseudonocardia sp. HH130630-07]|uniref:HAD hydrolase-like protein n=1 Tax=Pseudonocardia sp. HH130630-07 TaxID=1690815 RepID=UPI000814C180|nr:HAD hydrolase-like protein [Pseudonocardia sp. HH130630-07]ANY08591.1 haloacid dehalogenase [Pseudonocardia sp. HH130630-07]
MLTHILLDLDGTLVDSAPGILGSLRRAIDEVGLDVPESALGTHLLGPPMYRSLPPILGEQGAADVVPVYRRIYGDEDGWLASTPYPGVEELLRELDEAGVTIALATSKAESSARKIVAHHGWADLFTETVGDTPAGDRPTKGAVVGEALRRLGHPDGDAAPLMVGDRRYDVAGAAEHGLRCAGAGWGYAEPGELEAAGAAVVHASADELRAAILG